MNEIAVVTEQDIPDILRMIHEIYSELPNKEWFSLDSDEEVTSYMMTGGFGLKAMCDGRLAGDPHSGGRGISAGLPGNGDADCGHQPDELFQDYRHAAAGAG